jgi:hypothetical protein
MLTIYVTVSWWRILRDVLGSLYRLWCSFEHFLTPDRLAPRPFRIAVRKTATTPRICPHCCNFLDVPVTCFRHGEERLQFACLLCSTCQQQQLRICKTKKIIIACGFFSDYKATDILDKTVGYYVLQGMFNPRCAHVATCHNISDYGYVRISKIRESPKHIGCVRPVELS